MTRYDLIDPRGKLLHGTYGKAKAESQLKGYNIGEPGHTLKIYEDDGPEARLLEAIFGPDAKPSKTLKQLREGK